LRRIYRMAVVLGALALVVGVASAAAGAPPTASKWQVGTLTPSQRALSEKPASTDASSNPTFQFTTSPDTALLTTTPGIQKNLLGDIKGKTVTANFTIAGASGPFTYGGEGTPDNPCTPAVATTRLFFQTSNAGGFDFTHFWWSNPASVVVANGALQVTAIVVPARWSDWNGQFGTTVPDGFNAAASNVTDIGLSFGGGCFFENGVGAPGGASFTLTGFTVN
jgi:hypothetical protein